MAKLLEYLLEETSGTTAANTGTLGSAHDLTLEGSSAFTGSGGIDFPGTTADYASKTSTDNIGVAITLYARYIPHTVTGNQRIGGKSNCYSLQLASDEVNAIIRDGSFNTYQLPSSSLGASADTEQFFAFTYDASDGSFEIYHGPSGGTLVNVGSSTVSGSPEIADDDWEPERLGSGNGTDPFNGVVLEWGKYDEVLDLTALQAVNDGAAGVLDPVNYALQWTTGDAVVYPEQWGGGGISGTLAATETGADTFTASGAVLVSGALAATESGADTLAAEGSVLVSGALAATEAGADTLAASGTVLVSGTMAATETGADQFDATGSALEGITGDLAATEAGDDTFAGTGGVTVSGALAVSETGADTFAGTGGVLIRGSLLVSESDPDVLAAAGSILVSGALAATEAGADTFAGIGGVTVSGSMAATETGADVFLALSDPRGYVALPMYRETRIRMDRETRLSMYRETRLRMDR